MFSLDTPSNQPNQREILNSSSRWSASQQTEHRCQSQRRCVSLCHWITETANEQARLCHGRAMNQQQNNWRQVLVQKTSIALGIADQLVHLKHPPLLTKTPNSLSLHKPCDPHSFVITFSQNDTIRDAGDSKKDGAKVPSFKEDATLNIELIDDVGCQVDVSSIRECDKPLVDENTQCYLFGMLLFELFSGTRPFNSDTYDIEDFEKTALLQEFNFDESLQQESFLTTIDKLGGGEDDVGWSTSAKDLAFAHAVYVSKSECKEGALQHSHPSRVCSAESRFGQGTMSLKRQARNVLSDQRKFIPLLELGLPQPVCSLVRNLLKCGWGDFKPDEAYPCLEAARDDLQLLLKNPDRLLMESIYLDASLANSVGASENHNALKGGRSLRMRHDKLYGRESDVSSMLQAYCRVVSTGISEAFIISGYSGSGKSRLAQSMFSRVVDAGGYVVSKKFDQMKQLQPLSVVISAFNDLCDIMCREKSACEVNKVAESLKCVFGPNLPALTRVLPNVRGIIGSLINDKTPDPSFEEESNFNGLCFLLQRFMRVISSTSYPVMLFLDDLQWGDATSLGLIHAILSDMNGSNCLFFVGSYRDNEVNSDFPLFRVLDDLTACNVTITKVHLDGVCEDDLNSMISDTLCLFPRLCKTLTHMVYHKTKGNPFFVSEFLKTLVDRSLLRYSFRERRWTWDVKKIGAEDITDNVLHLLTSKLHTLSGDLQSILKMASCLGTRIGSTVIKQLPAISDGPNITDILDIAVSEGFMDKIGSDYNFAHDKVREAAYSLIKIEEQDRYHYNLGIRMYENASHGDFDGPALFTVIDQINHGVPHMVETEGKHIELAELNLKAGLKAMGFSNFMMAFSYLDSGISILPEGHWGSHYIISHELFRSMVKSAHICGVDEKVTYGAETILQEALSVDDKLDAYLYSIKSLYSRGDLNEGLKTCRSVLNLLGEKLPFSMDSKELVKMVNETQNMLDSFVVDGALSNLKTLEDKRAISAMHFYMTSGIGAYHANPHIYAVCACRIVQTTFNHGVCKFSSAGFAALGQVLCSTLFGDLENAHRIGKIAFLLNQHFGTTDPIFCFSFYGFIAPPFEPLQSCADMCKQGYEMCLSSGDVAMGSALYIHYICKSFYSGTKLLTLERDIEYQLRGKQQAFPSKFYLLAFRETILSLMGGKEKIMNTLTHGEINANDLLEEANASGNKNFLESIFFNRMMSSYWLGHFDRSRYYAEKAMSYMEENKVLGKFNHNIVSFYHGLISFHFLRQTYRKKLLDVGEQSIVKMKVAAKKSEWNFRNKVVLLEAELHSIRGEVEQAKAAYRDAIQAARCSRFIHEQGLACELAGNFHREIGDAYNAMILFSQAKECYTQWGSQTKIEHICHVFQSCQIKH